MLHWWFPVYDPAYAQLAPGWILLRELVAATPALGIRRIDLGRGDDEYKRRAKTGETLVSQGIVTRSTTRRDAAPRTPHMVKAAKASPLGPGLRQFVRRLRTARLSAHRVGPKGSPFMKVSVFGLGCIGCVSAARPAARGH